jgi:hypothetical protein
MRIRINGIEIHAYQGLARVLLLGLFSQMRLANSKHYFCGCIAPSKLGVNLFRKISYIFYLNIAVKFLGYMQ